MSISTAIANVRYGNCHYRNQLLPIRDVGNIDCFRLFGLVIRQYLPSIVHPREIHRKKTRSQIAVDAYHVSEYLNAAALHVANRPLHFRGKLNPLHCFFLGRHRSPIPGFSNNSDQIFFLNSYHPMVFDPFGSMTE